MVRVLAEHGGNVLRPKDDGTTPLMATVGLSANRSTTRRNRLIAPELVAAEWANDPLVRDTVHALLDRGADVSLDAAGPSGNTALHTAARYRFSAAAEVLLASGADADIENEAGTTAREMLDRLETGP
jgi:ankyrin repeat protein